MTDVSSVGGFVNLKELSVHVGTNEDVSALGGLSELKRLSLNTSSRGKFGAILDISPLASLHKLEDLHIDRVFIGNFEALGNLPLRQLVSTAQGFPEHLVPVLPRLAATLHKLDINFLSIPSVLFPLVC